MNQHVHCPACGQPLANHAPHDLLASVQLGYRARLIVECLSKAFPHHVPGPELVDFVYRHDREGGPLYAANVITSCIAEIRPKIEPYGWTIPKNKPGRGSRGYRLASIGPETTKTIAGKPRKRRKRVAG